MLGDQGWALGWGCMGGELGTKHGIDIYIYSYIYICILYIIITNIIIIIMGCVRKWGIDPPKWPVWWGT